MKNRLNEPDFMTAGDIHLVETPDEDAEDDDAYIAAVLDSTRHLNAVEFLERLIRPAGNVNVRDFYAFSDLSWADMEHLQSHWHEAPVERRRLLVKGLTESAKDNLDLQLGRFLRVALRDSDPEVRRLAIEGLWEDEDPDLIGVFVRLLNHDEAETVRAAAAAGLGNFVLAGELDELDAALAMRAEQALLAVVHNQAEPLSIRCRALESIAYSGEAGLPQLIENAYYAPEMEMQVSALRAMGRNADNRWRGLARAELHNPDAPMRAAAAWACGELEDKAAASELIRLLEDTDPQVRLAAISALGQLGGKPARAALRDIADGDNPEEAQAAEEALDEILFSEDPDSTLLLEDEDADEGENDDEDDGEDDGEDEDDALWADDLWSDSDEEA